MAGEAGRGIAEMQRPRCLVRPVWPGNFAGPDPLPSTDVKLSAESIKPLGHCLRKRMNTAGFESQPAYP